MASSEVAAASHSFESDSGEQASTTDDVESSQWTTDVDEDSETGERNGVRESDSEENADTDESKPSQNSFTRHKKVQKNNVRGKTGDSSEKTQVQSDTETRNLLDDVGEDFDEDYLDLEEAEGSLNLSEHHVQIDAKYFDLSSDQQEYYDKCFLYLLARTQGTSSLDGALNGSDARIIEFFRKSQLGDTVLSRIWALSDVNEDGFLNRSEFVVAMHLIILHIKATVPIPTRLPSPVRPPNTPIRQLFRLKDGCFTTSRVGESCSTSASSHTTHVGSDNTSSSSMNNSQREFLTQHPNDQYSQHFGAVGLDYVDGGHTNFDSATTSMHYVNNGSSCQTGTKQHSLSDDHLHVYANREVNVATFSDVPPLLVDSHPTALNATLPTTNTFRGPPPQPPPRKYTDSGAKGHGRSASLDLKTFVALSTYPPRSPHIPLASMDQNELSHPMPTAMLSQQETAFTSQSTQTDIPLLPQNDTQAVHNATSDYEQIFASHGLDDLTSEERCKLLKCLNDSLESERVKLSQIRLQLQLRVDEAQELLAVNPQYATKEERTRATPVAATKKVPKESDVAIAKPTAL
ncbi:cytoskeletal-regulatory complex EF hand domain-containing protein [Ditylenchus destructor]|nr:cytoskeletal-regulatory complex EF hand domain-containing protein [Ditylenchus destructor]